MSTPLELVEHQLAAYNDRNLERFLEVFSDDIEVTRLPGTVPAIVGKAALAKFYGENRFSLPAEKLGLAPDATSNDVAGLRQVVLGG